MMVTWRRTALVCSVVGLLAVNQTFAQQRRAQQEERQQRRSQQRAGQQQQEQKLCLSSKLTGMTIKDKSGQQCGQIQDLVVDTAGQVRYLAVSADAKAHAQSERGSQPAGEARDEEAAEEKAAEEAAEKTQLSARVRAQSQAGGQLILIPWDAAEFQLGASPARSFVMVQIEKDRLKEAPTFTEQQLTSPRGQAQLIAQVDRFFEGQTRGAARPDLKRQRENQRQNDQPADEKEREDN